jgi:perosamine synthetase
LTTGEGGIVTTDSEDEWELLKSLSNQGRGDVASWLHHVRLGWNYRIDDLSAAVGIAQLEKLDALLGLRTDVARRYTELLAGAEGLETPLPDSDRHERSWFVYVVKLARGVDRDRVIATLEEQGIVTRPYLPSIHLQPYMRERYGFRPGICPVSEDASTRTLALPFFPQLMREDQERVADALRAAIA